MLKIAIDKEDKRSRRLIITAAGRALLRKAYPLWKEAHVEVEFLIAPGSAENLRKSLRSLI